MTISKDLFLAILSMDAYNRGYGEGIEGLGAIGTPAGKIGNATIVQQSDTIIGSTGVDAGFYAVAYTVNGSSYTGLSDGDTVISYRGTDADTFTSLLAEMLNGWTLGAGTADAAQAELAAEFYQAVTGTQTTDPRTGDAILTGHSLGGGLAGFVAALSGDDAVVFDNKPLEVAA